MENSSNSTSSAEMDRYVAELHYIGYQILYPVFIILGVICNATCIIVLRKMLSVPANKYFLLLVTTDLIVCLLEIPIAVTSNGCILASFSAAVYRAYFGWTIIEFFDTLGIYSMLFLSYDRFLAVWYPFYFKLQNKVKTFRLRVTLTVIFNVSFHLFFLVNVDCSEKNTTVSQCNLTSSVIQDAFHANADQTWHKACKALYEILVLWTPEILMGVFSISLIAAIATGRLRNLACSSRDSKLKEFNLTVTLIGLICTFFVCTFPTSIWVIGFSNVSEDKCYGDFELLRVIGNILVLAKKVLNIVFLAMLNPGFKHELEKQLQRLPQRSVEESFANEISSVDIRL